MDIIALRLAHFGHFYSGYPERIRDSVERVLPFWSADHEHYGFVLGMQAFGLEECGAYGKAESLGRKAVELNPHDVWSAHAVAHVMEMEERLDEGIVWISSLSDEWRKVNKIKGSRKVF